MKVIGIGAAVLVLLVAIVAAVAIAGSGDDEVDEDTRRRARTAAVEQLPLASESATDCMADRIARNEALLEELESTTAAASTELADSGLADAYGDMMAACNSPSEMSEYMGSVFASEAGLSFDQAACLEDAMASQWDEGDWREFISLAVQPDRLTDAEAMVVPLAASC